MRNLTKADLDKLVSEMLRVRKQLEPHIIEYKDKAIREYKEEVVPRVKAFKDKTVLEYNEKAAPKIIKYKKISLTLFYMYTMTSAYRLSRKRPESSVKVGKVVR